MNRLLQRAQRPAWMHAVSMLVALVVAYLTRHLFVVHDGIAVAANQFLFTDWLVMEGLDRLLNKLECASFANTDYNKEFKKEFAVGDSVRVKYPQRYTVRDGLGYSPQPLSRVYTTVNVNQPFGIDFEWDSVEMALKMERGRERVKKEYLDPAIDQIAQEIDSRFAQFAYQNTPNVVGVLGTDPSAYQTVNQARQRMVELACPTGEKGL